jgi:hypothetical protein
MTAILTNSWEKLPPEAVRTPLSISINQIFRRVDNIRHTAVHRIRETVETVQDMVDVGCQFAQAFQDRQISHKLQSLHQAISEAIIRRDKSRTDLLQKFNLERQELERLKSQLEEREQLTMAAR